jgi:hypothetical protein
MKEEVPIWPRTGLFPVQATGSKPNREALATLAGNAPGQTSLYFFTALLYPYDTNPYDPLAVGVTTLEAPTLLGHLPAQLARSYRDRMQELGFRGVSACGAVLSGGLDLGKSNYDFVLELDLDLLLKPAYGMDCGTIIPSRAVVKPEYTKGDDGSYTFRCWLPQGTAGHLHRHLRMKAWTTPDWGTINYYIDNDRGIGLGHKVLSIPKPLHRKLFGPDLATPSVESIEERWASVRLRRTAS